MYLKNYFLFILISVFLIHLGFDSNAQITRNVLFLGNSYTAVNNLPQIIHDIAYTGGDTLNFDGNTPGGFQLINHSNDPTTQSKIMAGGWDYVVMQGQSQEPAIMFNTFMNGGGTLYNQVKQYNPCAVPMTYMTWGRKNGDSSNCVDFPEVCTYEGMDTTLRDRYIILTKSMNGETSPVSVVWHYLRDNYPNIELYQADESHPSQAGSYAAAVCFYTSIFKKDPTLINYNYYLTQADASIIRDAVKALVYDSLQKWDYKKMPVSNFTYQIGSGVNEINCYPAGQPYPGIRQTFLWNFGDGDTSSAESPTHSYVADGTYLLSLTTSTCDLQGLHTSYSDTLIQFCSHTPTVYSSHAWLCNEDTLWTQAADSYQWYSYGVPIPETNQYLADYTRYGISGFSVSASVNGCSEQSVMFSETPEWSGYFFDLMGDPCFGDTVAFAVLHINGSLTGQENIFWFKNDTLISAMNNEDTLMISSEGKYECRVINPNSTCPLDTTNYVIEYDCGASSVDEVKKELSWTMFPNPASEFITIRFSTQPYHETIQIFNATGTLLKSMRASSTTMKINIADLPQGIFYVRMNNRTSALKLIKL
jgi:hypothetical protein